MSERKWEKRRDEKNACILYYSGSALL